MSEQEKKYRRVGWMTSVGVQLVLLILFYFLIAWKEPFPPIPSYGIELSFGVEETGRGERPISNPTPVEEPQEETSEEQESTLEETAEETIEEEFSDPELEAVEEAVEQTETPITEEPSPDVVETKPEVVKEKLQPEKPKTTEKVEVKEEKELNPAALMTKTNESDVNTSKGEDSKEGVAGKKEGSIDGRALMGEQGSSDGAKMQVTGWEWDQEPQPNDPTNEEGKIVFEITIDSNGEIRNVVKKFSTLTPVAEKYYSQSIDRLTFSKTNDYKPAPTSTGTITFIIRSK